MPESAELFLLVAIGWALFRAARPLRDRLERWYASWLSPPRESRVVELRRKRDGSFGAEDSNGDV